MDILTLTMQYFSLTKLILFILILLTGFFFHRLSYPFPRKFFKTCFTILMAFYIGFVAYLLINHINFPLFLNLMDGVVWQAFERAASFQMIYPAPTPEYAPLAYNPLYYYLAVPFGWIFGDTMFTLRFVSILGILGSASILYLVVRNETESRWWGFIVVGLFAAAYNTMDAYLDTSHSDSWLLFSCLLGSYLIYLNRGRYSNLLGIIVLVSAFWFKQHGALFVIGGLAYLTYKEGIKNSLLYWLAVFVLGPLFYIFAGPYVFGPYFHYFTWTVPSKWSSLNIKSFGRLIVFTSTNYLILALSSFIWIYWIFRNHRNKINIWHFQFFIAMLSGLMGTMDHSSSNNIFILMGALFILCGTLGLSKMRQMIPQWKPYSVDLFGLFLSWSLLFFYPSQLLISPNAQESYVKFIEMLNNLDGPVYAPSLGQLPKDFKFYPAVHWVALDDMTRGPTGAPPHNLDAIKPILVSLSNPSGTTYIISDAPLEGSVIFPFISQKYELVKDFGDQYEPIKSIPGRYYHGWPRYLYKSKPLS